MKVYLLEYDHGIDAGEFEPIEVFATREQAEQVIEGLHGKPKGQTFNGYANSIFVWSRDDFEIAEFELR